MTTNSPGPESDPNKLSHRELRMASGIALALLPVPLMVTFARIIDEALGGDPTVIHDISFLMQVGSAVLGLAVLLLPERAVDRPTRKALLVGQCALMPVAVALVVAA